MSRATASTRRCGTVPDTPRPAGPATAPPRCPPTCPPCARPSSRGPWPPPRPGRPRSWPTRRATAPRCTPRRPAPRSGRPSAWPPGPGTRRKAPPSSAWPDYQDCAGTWTRQATCATRPSWGSARAARRSPPNCSDVHHGAGERPGNARHGLDVGRDQPAELVDVVGLRAHDHVVRAGDVFRLRDSGDLSYVRGHVGSLADFGLDEDVRLHHEVLQGPLRDKVP